MECFQGEGILKLTGQSDPSYPLLWLREVLVNLCYIYFYFLQ